MDIFNKIVIYLFNPAPGRIFSGYTLLGILAVLFIVAGIAITIYAKKNKEDKSFKKLIGRYPSKLYILAILILTYTFFRYYGVVFFSMRVMLYVLLLVCVYVIYVIIRTYVKKYPADKQSRIKQMEANKWVPSKHKNKKK